MTSKKYRHFRDEGNSLRQLLHNAVKVFKGAKIIFIYGKQINGHATIDIIIE